MKLETLQHFLSVNSKSQAISSNQIALQQECITDPKITTALNVFVLYVCLSICCLPCVTLSIPAILSQNVKNKSCSICVEREKYQFWITLRSLGSMRRGEVKLDTLQYQAMGSQAMYIKTQLNVSSPPLCWSKAVVRVRIKCTHEREYILVYTTFSLNFSKIQKLKVKYILSSCKYLFTPNSTNSSQLTQY